MTQAQLNMNYLRILVQYIIYDIPFITIIVITNHEFATKSFK